MLVNKTPPNVNTPAIAHVGEPLAPTASLGRSAMCLPHTMNNKDLHDRNTNSVYSTIASHGEVVLAFSYSLCLEHKAKPFAWTYTNMEAGQTTGQFARLMFIHIRIKQIINPQVVLSQNPSRSHSRI